MTINLWDLALLVVVSVQATSIAYVRRPRAKALLFGFPFPFSMAFLALGQPVDATNILGLMLLLGFMHAVRWLHVKKGWHIVAAIAAAVIAYALVGAVIAHYIPRKEWIFWVSFGVLATLAFTLLIGQPHRDEPEHRSPLPVSTKLLAVAAVITALVLAKQWLQGFMTVFPMVSVVAAYEARHSLWTMTRQVPVMLLSLGPMLVTIHVAQPYLGPYGALAVGWLVFTGALLSAQKLRSAIHTSAEPSRST